VPPSTFTIASTIAHQRKHAPGQSTETIQQPKNCEKEVMPNGNTNASKSKLMHTSNTSTSMTAIAKTGWRPQNQREEVMPGDSSSDDEDDKEDLGISNMLVSPTQSAEHPVANAPDLSQTPIVPVRHPEIEEKKDDTSDSSSDSSNRQEVLKSGFTAEGNEDFGSNSKAWGSGNEAFKKHNTGPAFESHSRESISDDCLETQEGFPAAGQQQDSEPIDIRDRKARQQQLEPRNRDDGEISASLSGQRKRDNESRNTSTLDVSSQQSTTRKKRVTRNKFRFGGDSIRAWLK